MKSLLLFIKEQNTQILAWIKKQNTSNTPLSNQLPDDLPISFPILKVEDVKTIENYLTTDNNNLLAVVCNL